MEINEFISPLKQSFEQAVVFHHQTSCLSEHEALRDYYEEIIPLLDGLIESLQGIYPRIGGYTLVNPVDWSYGISTTYFQGLYKFVQEHRTMVCQAHGKVQIFGNSSLCGYCNFRYKINPFTVRAFLS